MASVIIRNNRFLCLIAVTTLTFGCALDVAGRSQSSADAVSSADGAVDSALDASADDSQEVLRVDAAVEDVSVQDGSAESGDAFIEREASYDASDSAEAGQSCDKDHDGVLAPGCGGTDCCDKDPNVFPGQTSFFAGRNECGTFDYDCDELETSRWTVVGKACSWCVVYCCADDSTYIAEPPECGQSAEVAGCKGWFDCTNTGGKRPQECR